jgi:hypothetical protein
MPPSCGFRRFYQVESNPALRHPIDILSIAGGTIVVSELFRLFSGRLQDFCVLAGASLAVAVDERGKGSRIMHDIAARPFEKRPALLAITVGGTIAGAIDLTQACILFGWDIPLVIAGGLLGRPAFHGGAGTYVLGVFLHFFIAFSVTAIYYVVSRRLTFLVEHPIVCGLFFGAAVQEVMNLVVLPLSALHSRGPYELHDLLLGLGIHMVVIGLPVAFSVRRFAS